MDQSGQSGHLGQLNLHQSGLWHRLIRIRLRQLHPSHQLTQLGQLLPEFQLHQLVPLVQSHRYRLDQLAQSVHLDFLWVQFHPLIRITRLAPSVQLGL